MAAEMSPAAALVSRALNLSPIVGYLLAGILIGPGMLNLIHESGGTHLLAELGVVFLLFDIGMHVSLRELKESRGDLLGLAPVHLLLTGLISAGALYMLGISWPIAIAVGLSLGLSSTAVVARILTEREQNSCPIGRTATHVLIFQDIVAIFLMIFATSLGEGETAAGLAGLLSEYLLNGGAVPLAAGLLLAFVQALIAFGAAMLFSRYLLNPVFRTLAATRNDEAFTAFTLLLVLAAACATAMIGLSLTLGAFLAGLAVSGTPFRHQVQTEMGPFRGLLLSFFFISVGLSIDLPGLLRNLPLVVIGAFGILTVKTALGYIAAHMNGWSVPGATQLAPSWAMLGGKLSRELARRKQVTMETSGEPAGEQPVIVIGMSAAGRLAVDALIDFDIPYIATDGDPDRFLSAVADGYNVSFGDAANMKLIEAVGGSNARAVVLRKARYEVSKEVTPSINRRFPDLVRLVAVETIHDLDRYLELNIRAHLVAGEPKGIEMVADMLRVLGVPDKELTDWLSREADLFTIGDASDRQDKSDEEEAVVDEAA